jgi:hypothetical protein
MLGKIIGFAIGTILFGIGTTIGEYGIKKIEIKFSEIRERAAKKKNRIPLLLLQSKK